MASAEVLEVRHHEVEVRTQPSNIDHEFEEDEEMIAVAGCSEDLLVPGLDYEVSIFLMNSLQNLSFWVSHSPYLKIYLIW